MNKVCKTYKNWKVYCTLEVPHTEWVYASSEEEAKQVINDNFLHLTPHYAEEELPNDPNRRVVAYDETYVPEEL